MSLSTFLLVHLHLLFMICVAVPPSLSAPQIPSNYEGFLLPLFMQCDAVESALHNQDDVTDRWELARQRSMARHQFFSSLVSPDTAIVGAAVVSQNYPPDFFTKLLVGTPPVDTMLLVDTASDLIALQCGQCSTCYDPTKSTTFVATADCNDGQCPSEYLGADTFYSITTSKNISFWCTEKLFPSGGEGIVGLGWGQYSLISQLGIARRFSYCFKPLWSSQEGSGHLYIGREAPLLGNASSLTVTRAPSRPSSLLYFVTLEGISIGSERLNILPDTFERKPDGSGGTVIDSGSIYTYLNPTGYDIFLKRLLEIVELEEVRDDPMRAVCYRGTQEELIDMKVPYVRLHFLNLDVGLDPKNTFVVLPGGRICLTIARAREGQISMIGSYIQQNMNVGYDLEEGIFTMAAVDACTPTPF